nr:MAG TPA: hypothetical protein [Caudoviricetes sp.]
MSAQTLTFKSFVFLPLELYNQARDYSLAFLQKKITG